MRYLRSLLEIAGLIFMVYTYLDKARLNKELAEQTDKHWSANMQIALYDDELRKLKTQRRSLWVISSDGYYPYCGACGARADKMTDYCPACGRRMGGKL